MKTKIEQKLADEFLNYCHKHKACKDCKYNVNVGLISCSNAFFYDRAIDDCIKIIEENCSKLVENILDNYKELKECEK